MDNYGDQQFPLQVWQLLHFLTLGENAQVPGCSLGVCPGEPFYESQYYSAEQLTLSLLLLYVQL